MISILASALLGEAPAAYGKPKEPPCLAVDVAHGRLRQERALPRDLKLIVVGDPDRSGRVAGWQLAVYQRAESPRNLLYENPLWHGPHPSQFDAWSMNGYWPAGARTLKVNGYPLVLTAECLDCSTDEAGNDSIFVSGRLVIRWSKGGSAEGNPQSAEYERVARDILTRIEALSGRYPQLSAIKSTARKTERATPFLISYHYAHGVSAAPNPNYHPGKKEASTIKIYSPGEGIDLDLYFYEGQWPGQAIVAPIAIGDMKIAMFIDGPETATLKSLREDVIRIVRDEQARFDCPSH
jgi:hypothetical protein